MPVFKGCEGGGAGAGGDKRSFGSIYMTNMLWVLVHDRIFKPPGGICAMGQSACKGF